jgi:tetratricopeptide (TPR) repeat protein
VQTRAPLSRQFNILGILCQLAVLGLIALGFYFIDPANFFFYALFAYFGLTLALHYLVPAHQRRGLALVNRREFAEAIPEFEESYRFFKRHAWVDRFRFITVLDSSRLSYAELALLNRAHCLLMCGRRTEAIRAYRELLEEFPANEAAKKALQAMT